MFCVCEEKLVCLHVEEGTPFVKSSNDIEPIIKEVKQTGQKKTAIINLTISLLNGSLALIPGAYACKLVGIIPFIMIQTLVVLLQASSACLLTASIDPKKKVSFPDLISSSLKDLANISNSTYIGIYVKVVIILGTFGTIIGCWTCVGDVFLETFQAFGLGDTWLGNRLVVLMILSVLVYFLSTATSMDAIGFTSTVSLIGVAVMFILSISNALMGVEFNDVNLFGSFSDLPEAAGIIIFMYIWHFNHVAIYDSLADKKDMDPVILSGSALGYILIVSFSLLIYISFHSAVDSNALKNFDIPSKGLHLNFLFATILRISAATAAMFSIPCFVIECKANVFQCYSSLPKIPDNSNMVLTLFIVFVASFISAKMSNVGQVLSLTGSFCGSQLVFLFPGATFVHTSFFTEFGSKSRLYRAISFIIVIFGFASFSLLYFQIFETPSLPISAELEQAV